MKYLSIAIALALGVVACSDNLAAPIADAAPRCLHCGDPHATPTCDGGFTDEAGGCHPVVVHVPDAGVTDAQ